MRNHFLEPGTGAKDDQSAGMSNWSDKGRGLTTNEIRQLIRDACALLGKCALNTSPNQVLSQTPDELHFDDPPLRARPNHQKRALVYMIVHLLNEAKIYIAPAEFGADYFVDNVGDTLETAVDVIGNAQEYQGP